MKFLRQALVLAMTLLQGICTSGARAETKTIEQIIQANSSRIPKAALDDVFGWIQNHADQVKNKDFVTIIDFDQPSTARRMHVINMKTGEVEDLLVAHAKQSGENFATRFSNEPRSNMSSLGIYLTAEPIVSPSHGRALLLDGMESTNNNARRREIILHGADYVSQKFIDANGRLGRSLGCPAVEMSVVNRLVDELKGGSAMLIYSTRPPTTQPSDAGDKRP